MTFTPRTSLTKIAEAFGERGFEKFEHGEYRQAISDYDEAIRLDPDSGLYNGRGLAYQGIGKFDLALSGFPESGRRYRVCSSPLQPRKAAI